MKPNIEVATIFGEEIEKNFRQHLPKECVFILRLMGEQMMTMEKAINAQQAIIEKLLHFAVLEGNALQAVKAQQKELDKLRGSMAQSEHLISGEDE